MTYRTLGAILAAASVTVACFGDKAKPKQPPVPVAVTRAARRDVPYNLTADGVVEPMQTAQVQAQVGGILTEVTFKEGDEVQQGQVLFQIDPRPYKAALDQAAANLARDLATYADAKAEADRYTSLVTKDYVTKEQADQFVAAAGSAAAAVKGDSAALETAQINLSWTTIRAPISGITGQLLVKRGNLLRSGSTQELVLINQVRPILVHFALPATSLPAVQQYASQNTLTVTVVPGMPPSATAQPVLNGPTPAYTTEPTDDQQQEPVAVDAGSDPSSGGGSGGPPGGASDVPGGTHRHRGGGNGAGGAGGAGGDSSSGGGGGGGGHGTHGGAGSVASAGGSSAAGPSADPGTTTASTDGPPNTSGTGARGAGGSAGGNGSAGGGRAGGAGGGGAGGGGGGTGRNGAAPDSGANSAGGGQARRRPSMPGLPGVQAPLPSEGTLALIDNQVDTTTGTVLFKAKFQNQSGALWPGQFVATTLHLFVEQNALVVPAQAVIMGQQGTYVYLVDASGTARQRPVAVERTQSNTAVIAKGLTVGDQVVTDGQSRLTPGAKVNIRGLVPSGAGGTPPAGQTSPN